MNDVQEFIGSGMQQRLQDGAPGPKKNNKNIPQTGFATDGKHSVGDHITTLGESGRQLIHQLFHVLFDDQSSK